MTQKIEKLDNGLTLLGEANPDAKSVAVGFFVKTGARDETAKESGISHFLEHMMFKGTAKRNALEVTFDLGALGAQANAYTSEENTVYYSAVIPEKFEDMLELLCDMLRPSLLKEEFDTEKKVILEEIALYQDRPHFHLFESSLIEYFGKHSAGSSVLGTTESVGNIEVEEMRDYFERRYAPENMVLVASGKFDWEAFVDRAKGHCANWPSQNATRELAPFQSTPKKKVFTKKNLQQSHVLLINNGVSAQSKDRYPLSLLSSILGDSTASKFYWELIDSGLAESAGTDCDFKDGLGCFYAYASVSEDKLEVVTEKMHEILSQPLDFSEKDLERAKNKILSRIVLEGELPLGRLMSVGNHWLYHNKFHDLQQEQNNYSEVQRANIEALIQGNLFGEWSEFRLINQTEE